ncbi:MAG: hypothetical protein ACI3ZT_01720, partial [Candidatus Cryptobacteroides sp.]
MVPFSIILVVEFCGTIYKKLKNMDKNLQKMIAPRWCEEQNGVFVPLIGKVLEAKKLTPEPMTWYDFMDLAKAQGKQVATKEELLQMYLQKDEINAILKEHDGDLLEGWFGSSSEYDSNHEWIVNFGSGNCVRTNKFNSYLARAVAALQ